eukprot:GEMP01057244.1.p1 GENE.GEMP01057244.1~~GEMP01057244.1.p1  ORF type:complete len:135 (+),score=16.06 GEMP01057244.1:248-652(+)
MFCRRLKREKSDLLSLQQNNDSDIALHSAVGPFDGSSDDPEWILTLKTQPSSIYTGDIFQLRFRFSHKYPMESPEVIFLPPVPKHPHVYSNGHICLDILYDHWSPALTVEKMYCAVTKHRSPKESRWDFDDDKI